jgi:hemolysin activation/secretion protein
MGTRSVRIEAKAHAGRDNKQAWPLRIGALLALALASGQAVFADTPVLPAGAPTPGQVQSTLPTGPLAPAPKAAPLTSTPPPTTATIPPGGPTVTVQRFVITGNTVFGTDALQAEIAPYLGQPLTLADLYKVAEALTRYYQSRGYGLARATLPEQELSEGSVSFQIVEGRIGKKSVEGATRTHADVIEWQASSLKSGEVYTDPAMDRSVLLVNDLPGVQAQAVLQPGQEFGTADVVYKTQEDPEYSGQVSVDDYGRADTGRWRLNASANADGITGNGDRLSANLTHSQGNLLNFGGLTYSAPFAVPGGRLTAGYNQSEYRVGGPVFTPLELSGTSKNANLNYSYAELRSRAENLYLTLGMQHEAGTSAVKGELVSDTNINLLQLGAFFNLVQEDGSSFSLNGSFTSNGQKNDGNKTSAERARIELDASYAMPMGDNWTFISRGEGVWSPDPLTDTEKYSLGGPDNVRGFNSAEARGDSGLFASAELQRSLAPAWPFALGVYVDSGKVWDKSFVTVVTGRDAQGHTVTVPQTTPGSRRVLSSVGVEAIFQSPDRRWESRLEWAYAVSSYKASDGENGGHIWFTCGMNF